MTLDPWLTLLIGALGAAALSIPAGFLGAWIASRREHEKWIREQRLDAYRELLRVLELAWPMQSKDQTVWRDHQDAMSAALGVVTILGPDSVGMAAHTYLDATLDVASAQRKVNGVDTGTPDPKMQAPYEKASIKSGKLRAAFIRAAQKELNIKS